MIFISFTLPILIEKTLRDINIASDAYDPDYAHKECIKIFIKLITEITNYEESREHFDEELLNLIHDHLIKIKRSF